MPTEFKQYHNNYEQNRKRKKARESTCEGALRPPNAMFLKGRSSK